MNPSVREVLAVQQLEKDIVVSKEIANDYTMSEIVSFVRLVQSCSGPSEAMMILYSKDNDDSSIMSQIESFVSAATPDVIENQFRGAKKWVEDNPVMAGLLLSSALAAGGYAAYKSSGADGIVAGTGALMGGLAEATAAAKAGTTTADGLQAMMASAIQRFNLSGPYVTTIMNAIAPSSVTGGAMIPPAAVAAVQASNPQSGTGGLPRRNSVGTGSAVDASVLK